MQVEVVFRARLATLGEGAQEEMAATTPATPKHQDGPRSRELANRSRAIDKSVLAVPEPRRIRDRGRMRAVAKRPCLICGRQPSDAHHLRFAQARALAARPAMSSPFPCVAGIIAKFIVAVMNQSGGETSGLIRWLRPRSMGGRSFNRGRCSPPHGRPLLSR